MSDFKFNDLMPNVVNKQAYSYSKNKYVTNDPWKFKRSNLRAIGYVKPNHSCLYINNHK